MLKESKNVILIGLSILLFLIVTFMAIYYTGLWSENKPYDITEKVSEEELTANIHFAKLIDDETEVIGVFGSKLEGYVINQVVMESDFPAYEDFPCKKVVDDRCVEQISFANLELEPFTTVMAKSKIEVLVPEEMLGQQRVSVYGYRIVMIIGSEFNSSERND